MYTFFNHLIKELPTYTPVVGSDTKKLTVRSIEDPRKLGNADPLGARAYTDQKYDRQMRSGQPRTNSSGRDTYSRARGSSSSLLCCCHGGDGFYNRHTAHFTFQMELW